MTRAKRRPVEPPVPAEEARIEYVRLSELRAAPRNPKLHDVPAIMASIRRFGFRTPLGEDAATGRLVAGHGRWEAVEAIRAETPDAPPRGVRVMRDGQWAVPVVRGMAFDSEALAEEFLVADNRLVELAGWDERVMAPMLEQIAAAGAEALAAVGWTPDEVSTLTARVGSADAAPASFPEVVPDAVTVTYCCPSCQYRWSGSPDPAKRIGAPPSS